MNTKRIFLTGLALCAGLTANAAINFDLPGNSSTESWSGMTMANHPGYPGFGNPTAAWPSPISADDGDGSFDKVSGSGFPLGAGIYTFSGEGTFAITESTPLANLATIVLQYTGGYGAESDEETELTDFVNGPLLSYNSGSQDITGTRILNTEGLYGYQWDLSSESNPITDFAITFTTGYHASIEGLQLDQGDTFQAVPEPQTYAMIGGVLALGLAFIRRRKLFQK